MPRGGLRSPPGGRPRGALTRRTQETTAAVTASGLSPAQYLHSVMTDETAPRELRMEAATTLMAYCHPRLAPLQPPPAAPTDAVPHIVLTLIEPDGPPLIEGEAVAS